MSGTYDPTDLEWLLSQYRLGSLDESGCHRLESVLSSSEEARRQASRFLMDEVVIRNELRVAEVSRLFSEDHGTSWLGDEPVFDRHERAAAPTPAPRLPPPGPQSRWIRQASLWSAPVLAALLVVVGMAHLSLRSELQARRVSPLMAADLAGPRSSESTVTLVDSTLCLWDTGTLTPQGTSPDFSANSGLRLLEGIAAIELQGPHVGDASLQIEGPANWLFTQDGQLRMSYGKLTIDASTGDQVLSIDTPMGRVQLQGHGSLGVSCFGNDLEVHAFSGRARVDSLWVDETTAGGTVEVSPGEMVRLSIDQDSPYLIVRDVADSTRFASRLSMATDDLKLGSRYRSTVKADRPVGYWRFESIDDGLIANEMEGGQPLRVIGAVELRGNDTNRYAEFIDSLSEEHIESAIVTDEPIVAEPLAEYSVEIWVKPSHYHQASLVGLVAGPLDEHKQWRHGMLLELAGPHPPATSAQHPGRVRYLNRFPAAKHPVRNESVFSKLAYELRRWQHVVVVKDRDFKRLYINGELQARLADTNPLSEGLSVLVGRLHRERSERRFIGQLDELAIYDHALSASAVQEHYRSARHRNVTAGDI